MSLHEDPAPAGPSTPPSTRSGLRLWKWVALGFILLLTLAGTFAAWILSSTQGLNRMKRLVRARFPEVHQISTAEVAAMLSDPARKPVLLDIREKVEFEVSHLPGAIHVDPRTPAVSLKEQLPTNRLWVVYCSVGYRSSEMARHLLEAGATQVANLEGSIFQWANEGRVLQSSTGATTWVHPYNQTFGRLLRAEHRAPVPNVGNE